MSKQKILQEGQSYTFRSYFELPYDSEEILAELGYKFIKKTLTLPHTSNQLENITSIKNKIISFLPLVSLNNETARNLFSFYSRSQSQTGNAKSESLIQQFKIIR